MAKELPKGVRLLTAATAVRWFGWGLGEALIPIFLLMFADSFFQVGLLASIYDFVFFLFIPIAGYLADNYKAKRIIMASMIIYVFIGLGYWAAGVTSAAIFIILARALNGVSYSLDQIARESYIMRHVPKSQESRVFGRFDFVTNAWWFVAVIIGIFLVKYMPIHWLLFFIAPTSLITMFMVMGMQEKPIKKKARFTKDAYLRMFKQMRKFNKGLRLLALLSFFFGIISSIIYFFAPAISYTEGESIAHTVIIVMVYAIPALFGEHIGRFADKKKEKVYALGIAGLVIVLSVLAFAQNYYATLVAVFAASAIFELMYLANYGVMARIADKTHLGEVDGSLNGIGSLGAVVGPALFGLMVDNFHPQVAYLSAAMLVVAIGIIAYRGREHLHGKLK